MRLLKVPIMIISKIPITVLSMSLNASDQGILYTYLASCSPTFDLSGKGEPMLGEA